MIVPNEIGNAAPAAAGEHMPSRRRPGRLLWFLSQTLPWLGDLSSRSEHQIQRAFVGAHHRPFDSVDEPSRVSCRSYACNISGRSADS